ncbi:hypothetical protein [Cellulomonas hominis]|uniref:hypothetical protein n=1 Tax=Cellulomonas hominis TaxID=156981 RepID=UPI001443DE03|nr:hypothetical protein [Cellulomonas hominis]NKY10176.1 hypothetical protein [Cellulomonas hominis]
MTARRLAAVVAGAVAVLVVLLLSPASAARLGVTAGNITTASATPCSTTAVTAGTGGRSGTITSVVLSGVPVPCRGLPATLRLYASDGTPLATADTTVTLASADSTTVTVPAYATSRAAGVALTVGTWGLPVTWTAPSGAAAGPVTPGAGTDFGALTWTRINVAGAHACVSVPVSGAAGTRWQIDLHLDQRPFNGVTSGSGFRVDPWWAGVLDPDPVDGVVSVGGTARNTTLTAGQSFTVTVCHDNLPPPLVDPALAYSQTSGAVTGNEGYACLPTTVSVTGTPEFFAGWTADVDLAPLAAYFAAKGLTVGWGSLSTDRGSDLALSNVRGTTWRVTPKGWPTYGVRDGAPQTFSICASKA